MKRRSLSLFMIIVLTAFLAASCSSLFGAEEEPVPESDSNTPSTSHESFDDDEIAGDTVDLEDDPFLQEDETNDIRFEQEQEGTKIERVASDPAKFAGKWTATSDQAAFFYGNVDIVINSNGSWTADITGEKLGGQWKAVDDHIHMDDSSSLNFDFDLAFDKNGVLIMTEHAEDGSEINTVLTKAN